MEDAGEEDEFSSAGEEGFDARQPDDGDRDFDDDFNDYPESPAAPTAEPSGSGAVANQPYDEAHELSDEDDDASPAPKQGGPAPSAAAGGSTVQNQPFDEAVELSSEGSDAGDSPVKSGGYAQQQAQREPPGQSAYASRQQQEDAAAAPGGNDLGMGVMKNFARGEGETMGAMQPMHDDASEDQGSPERQADAPVPEGIYDPAEYANLRVSQEISELFQYIGRYKPHNIELETKMRPFIPDYIPAVGEIDPFVKVPRPDSKPDHLGLATLDEPAANQSDKTVFTLQLRAVTKSSGAQPMLVRSVELAEKNPKVVTNWINSINDLHRHKPAPSVRYSKPMPDIEALMQIWPAQFEELLETARLPDAELAVELPELVRIMCAMLDIPVYSSLTESLHVLFSLYSDFKANVHFQQQLAEEGGIPDGASMPV